MAATVAHAIELLPNEHQHFEGRGRDKRLLLWIVGAREPMEGELARAGHLAEPIAALCDHIACRGLELVLIGPEMKEWEMERPASSSQRPSLLVRALSATLHVAMSRETAAAAPDAIVLFNSGIGTLIWPLVEAWLPSISAMLALEVPILLTCFNEREKEGEQMLFGQAFEAHNLLAPRVNPFAHVVPLEVIADGNDNRMSEAAAAELVVRVAAEVDAEEARAAAARADAAAATANTGSADMEAVGRGGLRAEDIQALMSSSAARATDINSSGSGANGCACSNTYVTWVRGSSLARDALHTFAQRRASELLKTCAKLFALKNMDAWLAFLDADAPCADVNRGETVAANCMLLAEATDEIQLAALAHQKGAQTTLRKVVRQWAPLALNGFDSTDGTRGDRTRGGGMSLAAKASSCTLLNYAGLPAVERIIAGATTANGNIDRLVEQSKAIAESPTGKARPLGVSESRWRNVFKGDYINVRAQPNTQSTVVARLPQEATFTADAELGGWIRLVNDPASSVPGGSWALVKHPLYGTLLEQTGPTGN